MLGNRTPLSPVRLNALLMIETKAHPWGREKRAEAARLDGLDGLCVPALGIGAFRIDAMPPDCLVSRS